MTHCKRRPDVFKIKQKVVIQNKMSKLWNIKGIIISRREHQGLSCNSYVIKVCKTSQHVCQSEQHIRAIPTNNDTSGINISNYDTTNSALFSSTGCKIRSSLRSSSERTLSGGKDRLRARVSAALSATCIGSQASPAPTKDSQPGQTS